MSLHFPLHTPKHTHTVSGSFLQKSAHWTNPLALAAGREKQRWTLLPDPKLSSFSNHLSKHPSLSLQCSDERERGQDEVKVGQKWWGEMGEEWKEIGCRKRGGRKKRVGKRWEGKVLHFAAHNGLSIHQFVHMHTKKVQHDDEEMENQGR